MCQDEDDGGEDQLQQQDEDTAEESDVAIAIKFASFSMVLYANLIVIKDQLPTSALFLYTSRPFSSSPQSSMQ